MDKERYANFIANMNDNSSKLINKDEEAVARKIVGIFEEEELTIYRATVILNYCSKLIKMSTIGNAKK